MLPKELGMNRDYNFSGDKIYKAVSDVNVLISSLVSDVGKSDNSSVEEKNRYVSKAFWTPKIHIIPYKSRFIASVCKSTKRVVAF